MNLYVALSIAVWLYRPQSTVTSMLALDVSKVMESLNVSYLGMSVGGELVVGDAGCGVDNTMLESTRSPISVIAASTSALLPRYETIRVRPFTAIRSTLVPEGASMVPVATPSLILAKTNF